MSIRWRDVLAWVASMLAIWVILGSQGLSLAGLMGASVLVSLALLTAFWVARRPSPSIWQVLQDVDGERVLAPRTPVTPAPRLGPGF
jgi:uncharacterized membrane protein